MRGKPAFGKDQFMLNSKIGEAAGRVWEILGTKDEVALTSLPKMMKLTSDVAYQALGWLAREGKVKYRNKGGKVYISLDEREREHFKNNSMVSHSAMR
jgi:hypothetical protein